MFALFNLGGSEIIVILSLLVLGPLILALTVFWIWMLVDAIQNKGISEGEKIGWVLAIVFCHALGSLLYFCIGRPKGKPLPAAG